MKEMTQPTGSISILLSTKCKLKPGQYFVYLHNSSIRIHHTHGFCIVYSSLLYVEFNTITFDVILNRYNK